MSSASASAASQSLALAAAAKPSQARVLLEPGSEHTSPGGHYSYRVLGPCCRLFDREELPWPCCRLAWRSKEPSWRRVGRRFVADLAARRCPSYAVELLQPGARNVEDMSLRMESKPAELKHLSRRRRRKQK